MKVEIQCKYKVTVSGELPVVQSNELNVVEPTLYPDLKDLEKPTPENLVDHVLKNQPQVKWVLTKADE